MTKGKEGEYMKISYKGENLGIKKVVEYLQTRDDIEPKPDKSVDEMWRYITDQARKQSKNGSACIEDEVVYGWAVHYFDETNEDLGIHKKSDATQPSARPEPKVEQNEATQPITKPKKEKEYEQQTLFDFM